MKKIGKFICVLISAILLLPMFSGCLNHEESISDEVSVFLSYLDIPGITQEEIDAIITLQETTDSFVFGMMPNTEAFSNKNGEIRGYTALLCEWLSELFGIDFIPKHVTWNDLLDGLANGAVDFTGTLTLNEERRLIYSMTDAIAHRTVKYIRLTDSMSLDEIRHTRLPRYAMLMGSATVGKILNSGGSAFEPVYIDEYIDAYELLKKGEIDALVAEGTAEAIFDAYSDIIVSDFLPLIYTPVSLATQNPALAPIVSVMQKALENNANRYLSQLYNQGYQEYIKHKLFLRLTKDEIDYIEANQTAPIPFAAEYDKYPISFFNPRDNEWQGIAFDSLQEVSALTGLEFEVINESNTEWYELLKMLEDGDALVISELFHTPDRADRFLWPKSLFFIDQTSLISKTDYPNISINEVLSVRIGLSKDTAHAELFQRWFPDHNNVRVYDSKTLTLDALARNEIDMAMTYLSSLLYLTHYQEVTGYKANFVFNHGLYSTFGFNKNEDILCSIVDKALVLIDTEIISEQWLRRPYDFNVRLVEAQTPWIIATVLGASSLVLFAFIFITIVYMKNVQKRRMASNYEYANRLSGTLANITRSETIFSGILKEAADMIAREGCIAMNVSCVGIWEATAERDCLKSISCYDISTGEYGLQADFDLSGSGDYKKLFETERLIVTNNTKKSAVWCNFVETYNPDLCAILDVPIHIDGKLSGAVCIEQFCCEAFPEEREWTIEEQNFASSLADLMALAISGAERRIARDEAVMASRAKTEFLAKMSHEIRTPMNSIMGFAELAADKTIESQTKNYLSKITDSTEWLLRIINDILDISKIEFGKMDLEHMPFNLNDVIAQCESVILPSVEEKGLDFQVYSEPLSGKKVIGDPVRLYQALINLLSNAVKFTNAGTVHFSSKIKNSDNGSVTVAFEVKDSGIGMSPEQLEKVFAPFIQADSSTTRNYGGTGLGLAITKSIIELMGGSLDVQSSLGGGSIFYFELAFETSDVPDSTSDSIKFDIIEKPFFDGLVLICDDNSMNQEVICEHLANVGLRTEVAENGKTGVDIVLNRIEKGEPPFDLIFMDMYMPVMDGMEAAAKIMELNAGTPIIAMTANIMASDLERYAAHGMPDYVGKPFTSQELWRVLLKYLKPVSVSKEQSEGTSHVLSEDELQHRLLINFVKNNQNKYEEIVEAIEARERKTAHRLAHTLKGSAGLIGRFELQKAAEKVEAPLKNGINSISEDDMNNLEIELKSVLDELRPLLDEPQKTTRHLNSDEVTALFEKLKPMLENINPECVNLLDDIRAVEGAEQLAQQIEDYDFESAVVTLAELKEKWV